jgi:pyruvate dehydrogenase E1 component alpha subunit
MPGVRVDARDVREMYRVAGEAIERARSGGGPTFVVAEAFRLEGHYYGDPQHYRAKEEIENWRATSDPLLFARDWLTGDGLASGAELDAIDAEVDAEMEKAITWAEAGPLASPITPEEIYASA